MSTLPQFKKFNIHEETTALGTRWKLWLSELENLLLALDIKDKKRQRAMLLYSMLTPLELWVEDANCYEAFRLLASEYEPVSDNKTFNDTEKHN